MMPFAFAGHPEYSMAVLLAAFAVALPLIVLLARRTRYKVIPMVAIPALAVAIYAGVVFYQETVGERIPPLTNDLVILIDDSRSMGEADDYVDVRAKQRVAQLTAGIRAKLTAELPGKIEALKQELADKVALAEKDNELWFDADLVRNRLEYWRSQSVLLDLDQWRPTRLQIVQALLTQAEPTWLHSLQRRHQARIHLFHLDATGHAVKLPDGDLVNPADPEQMERARQAIARLEPVANDSRLGDAVREAIEAFADKPPERVLVFTDGIATRGRGLIDAGLFAANSSVRLMFVGLGNERKADEDRRELKPALLKPVKVLFVEGQPRYEFRYIKTLLEREAAPVKKQEPAVEPPIKIRPAKQPEPKPADIAAQEKDKEIPEVAAGKPGSRKQFGVLLLEAEDDFDKTDSHHLANFPATLDALNEYDVLILGDCDPNHPKLKNHLKDIVHFARGEDEAGKPAGRLGGGVLFLAGTAHNPHRYKGTPLAEILPVQPIGAKPPEDKPLEDRFRPTLTRGGRLHPIFRFGPDEAASLIVWNRLPPMYWTSSDYRLQPLAGVLAEHPNQKGPGGAQLPLVAHLQSAPGGRCSSASTRPGAGATPRRQFTTASGCRR